jgi:integrase
MRYILFGIFLSYLRNEVNYLRLVRAIQDDVAVEKIALYLKERNYRDFLLFTVGITLGIRISDLLMLRVRDVRDTDYIYIKEKKTGKTKHIKITADLNCLLEDHIKNLSSETFLFKSQKGKNRPITRHHAYIIIRQAARACGVRNIGTHSLRKTFGRIEVNCNVPVEMIQKMLNHKTTADTLRYLGIEQEHEDKARSHFNFRRLLKK